MIIIGLASVRRAANETALAYSWVVLEKNNCVLKQMEYCLHW